MDNYFLFIFIFITGAETGMAVLTFYQGKSKASFYFLLAAVFFGIYTFLILLQ